MIGIYSITNKINGKRYIGKSENIEARTADIHRNKRLDSAIKHYGVENFEVEIIEECSKEALNEREIYWISYYHTYIYDSECHGYNMTRGGEGVDSESASAYNKEYWQRDGVRESRSGGFHHFYGKHHTEESKELIASVHRGTHLSDEHKKKLSAVKRGVPLSEYHRMRISETRKGIIFTEEHRKNIGLAGKGRIPWNKGKELGHHSEEHNKKISESMRGKEFTPERCENIKRAKQGKVAIYLDRETKYISVEEVEYYLSIGWSRGIAPRVYKMTCKICGSTFEASHNSHKLCQDCKNQLN